MEFICDQCLHRYDKRNNSIYTHIQGRDYIIKYYAPIGHCRFCQSCNMTDDVKLYQISERYFPIETEIRGISLVITGYMIDGLNKLIYSPLVYLCIGYLIYTFN